MSNLPPGRIDLSRQPAERYRETKAYSTWHEVHIIQTYVLDVSGRNISASGRKIAEGQRWQNLQIRFC